MSLRLLRLYGESGSEVITGLRFEWVEGEYESKVRKGQRLVWV